MVGVTDGLLKLSCNPTNQIKTANISDTKASPTFQSGSRVYRLIRLNRGSKLNDQASIETDSRWPQHSALTAVQHSLKGISDNHPILRWQGAPYDGRVKTSLPVPLRLLLVRHGLSSFNRERRIQGRSDLSTLTSQGQEQARQTGQALKEIQINAVYSSPLKRAASTTTNLLASKGSDLRPCFDDGLLEIDLAPWSGLCSDEVKSMFPDAYRTWKQQPQELVLKREDGNPYKPIGELMEQAREFLRKLIQRHPMEGDETVLVVSHNCILRCLILVLLGEPDQGLRRLRLDNASLSVFNLIPLSEQSHQAQVECLNSTVHLHQQLPSKGKGPRLILVRHGETDWNQQGRFQGQIDIPLNKNGFAQAAAAGAFLSDVLIDQAYSSSMTRPRQTAEAILKHHPDVQLEVTQGLVEIGHGLWEGKLESDIEAGWPELLDAWKKAPQTVQMPEGETIQDVWKRSVACWNKIANSLAPEATALVVAHDAVNKTILCHLLGMTPADIWAVKQGNGGVTVVDIATDPGQPAVVTSLNLTSHLGGVLDRTAAGAL